MHINIACDLGYRPMVVHDEGNCLFLVLLGKATACRTHSLVSRLIRATNPCVHQSGNGPLLGVSSWLGNHLDRVWRVCPGVVLEALAGGAESGARGLFGRWRL